MSTIRLTLSTGRQLLADVATLSIGHTEACEVRVTNTSPYADEVLGIIRRNDGASPADTPTWTLIRTSPHHELRVNGMPIHLLHHLAEGDRVEWPDQPFGFTFQVAPDSASVVQGSVVSIPRHLGRRIALWASLPTLLLAVGLVLAWMFGAFADRSALTPEMLSETRQSVYQLNVDSIKLLRISGSDTTVVRTLCLTDGNLRPIVGTAFLTTDSLLVTARHCIEPWLNDEEPFSAPDPTRLKFAPSVWALEAETYNQLHADSEHPDVVMRMETVCTLWAYEGEQARPFATVRSTDFTINSSRDDIVELGDFSHEYYWRSIKRRHQRKDMMREDAAVLPFHQAGTIRLAPTRMLPSLLAKGNERLEFFGFPDYADLRMENTADRLRHPIQPADEDSTLIDMLATGGDLRHGYSGGPVMVRQGNACWCVGLVSVTDARGKDRFYAVPSSELWRLRP